MEAPVEAGIIGHRLKKFHDRRVVAAVTDDDELVVIEEASDFSLHVGVLLGRL